MDDIADKLTEAMTGENLNVPGIKIKELTKSDIGKYVSYREGTRDQEHGALKSWNDHTVFVVFHCNDDWEHFQDYTGQGCHPADLEFVESL